MTCLIRLWERPLDFHVSAPCSHVLSLVLTFLSLTLTFLSLTFTSATLRAPLSPSLAFTYLGLILLALYTSLTLIPLHQIVVCGTLALSQSYQCDAFRSELAGGPTKTMLVAWSYAVGLQKSEPNNQHRASGIRRLRKLWWGPALWKASLRTWNHQSRAD